MGEKCALCVTMHTHAHTCMAPGDVLGLHPCCQVDEAMEGVGVGSYGEQEMDV